MPDLSAFKSSDWDKLTPVERVAELQKLEGQIAKEQGRPERTVRIQNMPDSTRGHYSMNDPNHLWINSNLVMEDKGNYQAMQTTIHEGRHAYQDDCIRGRIVPEPQDKGKVESWAHNSSAIGGVYNSAEKSSFIDYRYQPKEVDANNFANEKMDSFSSQFQDDKAFSEFSVNQNMENQYTEAVAKSTYGDNYEHVIQSDIEHRYQAKVEQESKMHDINNAGGNEKMFDFKKDKAQRQQSSQNSSQQSSQDKAKAFRQSLKVDQSKQQAAKKSSAQSSSSSQSGAPSAAQRERTRTSSSSNASKYKASSKTSTQSKSSAQTKSKGGQER